MLKTEQVGEMAIIMKEASQACGYFMYCPFKYNDEVFCGNCVLAEAIYNAGYRKVDGEDYVSMEWHEEQVQHAQDEIDDLKLKLQHAEELKRQAMRDFAEYLQEYAEACEETSYDGRLSAMDIEEKLQQFWEEYDK